MTGPRYMTVEHFDGDGVTFPGATDESDGAGTFAYDNSWPLLDAPVPTGPCGVCRQPITPDQASRYWYAIPDVWFHLACAPSLASLI